MGRGAGADSGGAWEEAGRPVTNDKKAVMQTIVQPD